jgi:hypothetical protein
MYKNKVKQIKPYNLEPHLRPARQGHGIDFGRYYDPHGKAPTMPYAPPPPASNGGFVNKRRGEFSFLHFQSIQ